MPKKSNPERDETIAKLREWFPKGSTVYTIMEHKSRSGMLRYIRVLAPFIVREKGKKQRVEFLHPNHSVALVLGWRRAPRGYDGIRVGGCGMDMGFHLAYSLSHVLYGDGYALSHRWL